mmetsp:Transcript_20509/g.33102  ORF Transcript_20509/g.33102 Transcript_20509/m.33102 type:complete len:670 (+) Transcript_20509:127-2136(+)
MFKKRRRKRTAEAADGDGGALQSGVTDAGAAEPIVVKSASVLENDIEADIGKKASEASAKDQVKGPEGPQDDELRNLEQQTHDFNHEEEDDDENMVVLGTSRRRKKDRRNEQVNVNRMKTIVRPLTSTAMDIDENEDTVTQQGHMQGDYGMVSKPLSPNVDVRRERLQDEDEEGRYEVDDDTKEWEAALLKRAGAQDLGPHNQAEPIRRIDGEQESSQISRSDIIDSVRRLAQDLQGKRTVATDRTAARQAEIESLRKELEERKTTLAQVCNEHDRRQRWRKFIEGLRECLKHKAPMIEQVRMSLGKLRRERFKSRERFRQQSIADLIHLLQLQGSDKENCGADFPRNLLDAKSSGQAVDDLGRDVALKLEQTREQRIQETLIRWSVSPIVQDEEGSGHRALRIMEVLRGLQLVFTDVAAPFDSLKWLEDVNLWQAEDAKDFETAYIQLALPELVAPYVNANLIQWDIEQDLANTEGSSIIFSSWDEVVDNVRGFEWIKDLRIVDGLLGACIGRDIIPFLCYELKSGFDLCSERASNVLLQVCDLAAQEVGGFKESASLDLAAGISDSLVRTLNKMSLPLVDAEHLEDKNGFPFQVCDRHLQLIMHTLENSSAWLEKCQVLRAHPDCMKPVRVSVRDLIARTERFVMKHEAKLQSWPALGLVKQALDDQ